MRWGRRIRVKIGVRLRVRNIDWLAGDAVDMTAHDLAVAHQLDLGRISHPDRCEVRLLETAVDALIVS